MTRLHAGVSLVETVVALAILGGGLLVVAATAARAVSWLRSAEAVLEAGRAAETVLDSLTQLESPRDGSGARGRATLRWTTSGAGETTRILLWVRYADGTRVHQDSFTAVAARWPHRLNRVP